MSSVYKDRQNEAFSEAVSKQINHFDITGQEQLIQTWLI